MHPRSVPVAQPALSRRHPGNEHRGLYRQLPVAANRRVWARRDQRPATDPKIHSLHRAGHEKISENLALGRFSARRKGVTAISHGLWLRVTLQFAPCRLRDDEAYALIRHAKQRQLIHRPGSRVRRAAKRRPPESGRAHIGEACGRRFNRRNVQPTKLTRSCSRASSALAGCVGSCRTVAAWPSHKSVNSTMRPSGNSRAS